MPTMTRYLLDYFHNTLVSRGVKCEIAFDKTSIDTNRGPICLHIALGTYNIGDFKKHRNKWALGDRFIGFEIVVFCVLMFNLNSKLFP